jgi:hypothetical protein
MSYSPAGRWVSERMSSATPSENEQASPNPGYGKPSTRFMVPLGMPRNYDDEDYEDYEHHQERNHGFQSSKYKEQHERSNNSTAPFSFRTLLLQPQIVCFIAVDNEAQRMDGLSLDDRDVGGSVTNNLNFAAPTAGIAPERKLMTPVATLEMTDSEYV